LRPFSYRSASYWIVLGLGECKADYSSLPRVARHCLRGVMTLQRLWSDAP